jgi:DNA-binding transcriptional LysR family regulator
MNLRTIDLNLLVILDKLLDEAHVSRAAAQLGLTQPAVSAALQRLRGLFDDQLLQRSRGTMRPTPRAVALRDPLKALLADVRTLIDPPDVPLAEIRQSFRFIVTDHVAAQLLPPLLARLAVTAPGIDLILLPWSGGGGARAELLRGDADLALSVFDQDVPGIERQQVLDEHYVIAMRPGHPALEQFSVARWLAFPHIVVSGHGGRRGSLDDILERQGLARRVGLVVPSFQTVPSVLLATDLIAMLPAHSIAPEARERLVLESPPLPIASFPVHLAWPSRMSGDKALTHVRDTLAAVLADEIAPAA